MPKENVDALRKLRDTLVDDRRALVSSMLADPNSVSETASDFMNLQQLVDIVERAIGHELSLERPDMAWPPKPRMGGRPS